MPPRAAPHPGRRAVKAWWWVATLAIAVGCGPVLFLGATNLEVTPPKAQPGDIVQYSFHLIVAPEQRFTVLAYVDGKEHISQMDLALVDSTYTVTLGDAADLINTYGVGQHVASIEVRLVERSRIVHTPNATFELQETPVPTPPAPR